MHTETARSRRATSVRDGSGVLARVESRLASTPAKVTISLRDRQQSTEGVIRKDDRSGNERGESSEDGHRDGG